MDPDAPRPADRIAAARTASDRVVLEGFHPLKHALRFGARIEEVLLADRDRLDAMARSLAPDLTGRLAGLAVTVVEAEVLAAAAGGRSHGTPDVLTIAARPQVDTEALLADVRPSPLILLEAPTHLGNVGAVVRVAAAAGAAGVLTTGPLDPWHAAALRGSAGLHFALPVARVDSIDAVLESGRPLVAADPDGDARLAAAPARAVLALGSERRGLSRDVLARADLRVRIPMRAGVSSLNLATAAAVLLYVGAR